MKEAQTAFVFPGQGVQRIGMGESLYASEGPARLIFAEAADVLHFDIATICFYSPGDTLNRTEFTQPGILTTSIAALSVLERRGRIPDQVAGHSLGEYSALVAAKAITFAQALKLVQSRGKFMESAGKANPGAMTAIRGLTLDEIKDICARSGAEIANINTRRDIVITGKNDSVLLASEMAKNNKGIVYRLKVSVAGHSSLMQPAREQMEMILQETEIHDPQIPFVANTTGNYMYTAEEVRQELARQVTGCVYWLDTIQTMQSNGVERFVDVGPGKVLAGIIKRIDREIPVESFDR